MSIMNLVANIPLFHGLPREQLEEIVDIMVDQTFGRGQSIFSEGEEATGFYVVISGRVKIFKLSSEGKEQVLHFVGPGESFGEVPMFAGGYFPAHAETIEKSRLFFFPRSFFLDLIKRDPAVAMNMLAELSMRLRRFTLLVEELSLKEVPGRLAAYLLYLSDRENGSGDLELNVTKGQLASLLGTIPETMSRILGKMTAQGIIEVQGRRIRIQDRDALEELSSGRKTLL
ncbi:MAG: Crp/Fnr family transcriptional regulator [Alphaproteobacteria bacterium]|uniref:Crp/Fnr family transcriptional regulator n=1 Tax=Candidatus Nitrobium versatile TaxID=2884831 RepID=A0A953J681_9BACT|nr:Crp/Fnr family transcriptional regulator [Candidatus Nitrobium versatile]